MNKFSAEVLQTGLIVFFELSSGELNVSGEDKVLLVSDRIGSDGKLISPYQMSLKNLTRITKLT
jgi:hypothetical protein